jgi:hypothetical protein
MERVQVTCRGQGVDACQHPHILRRGRSHHHRVQGPGGDWGVQCDGYTNFSLTRSLQGGKTRVLILVKTDLAVRGNVKVIADIMDQAVQSVWLHFSHHRIGSATLGAFILGGFYKEWTPLLSSKESRLRLGSLLEQISKATDGSCVLINGNFNVDLDRVDDSTYYMATLAKSFAECTNTSGLETHTTSPTFRSYGNFIPHPAGDLSRSPGSSQVLQELGHVPQEVCQVRQEVDKVRPGGSTSPEGDFHKYARLDHVYTKGLVSESKVMPNATTDHRPVVTTNRQSGHEASLS